MQVLKLDADDFDKLLGSMRAYQRFTSEDYQNLGVQNIVWTAFDIMFVRREDYERYVRDSDGAGSDAIEDKT